MEAGFDFVEGTISGMGERAGNVALADVMVRLLEKGRSTVEASDRNEVNGKIRRIFGRMKIRRRSIWAERYLDQNLIENMGRWHNAAHTIGEIYATQNRFERTSLGDPEAYAAGSGPHAQANRAALENPVQHPLWRNYARTALEHDMLGRPEAAEVVRADRERLRTISLKTHAAGGSTAAMHAETVNEAGDTERKKSIQMARDHKEKIIGTISNTTTSRRIDIFQRRRSIRSRPVDPNSETAVFDSIKDGK